MKSNLRSFLNSTVGDDIIRCMSLFVIAAGVICPFAVQATNGVQLTVVQQYSKITGTIVDANKIPIVGANIIIKGKQVGVITDVDGNFSIDAQPTDVLVISYIGCLSQELHASAVNGKQIVLEEDLQKLEEVVVVGYGTQKKATLTGAVSAVATDDIMVTKNQFISNSLSGKVPGLRVWEKTGEPGAISMQDFQIRGMGAPLVVIDGVPRTDLIRLDPNEIESVSVLKDASAAIYGVRAANGVILISTKKGKKGKAELKYNGFVGWQKAIGLPDVLDAVEYMTLMNERDFNNHRGVLFSEEQIEAYRNGTKQSTDWAHMGQREFAPQTQHNVSLSGGSEKIDYFINFSYVNQEGLFESNSLDYQRYNIRSNVTAQITDRLKGSAIIGGWMDTKHGMSQGTSQLYKGAWTTEPIIPAYANDNPAYLNKMADGLHPLAITDREISGYNDRFGKSFSGTFDLEYAIPGIDGLKAKGMYSYNHEIRDEKNFRKSYTLYEYKNDSYVGSTYGAPSRVERKNWYRTSTLLSLSLSYQKTFLDKHNINALALYEEGVTTADNFSALREVSMDVIDELFAGNALNQVASQKSDDVYKNTNKAFVGRVNYDFSSKYLAEFSFRYDGSSKFAPGSQWGFFPSVSAGYRISEEPFFKQKLSFVDNLKLRVSYGVMGSDASSSYQFLSGYNYPSSGFIFNDNWVNGISPGNIPNPFITWYKTKTTNMGFDFGLWNGLLGGTFDYFIRKRTGLLADPANSLPSTVGAKMSQYNLNSERRHGFEVELTHRNKIGKFHYSISGNFAFTRVKNLYRERAASGSFYDNWRNNSTDRYWDFMWGYGTNGQYGSFQEIYNAPNMDSKGNSYFFPGAIAYDDWNGDGMIDGLDMKPLKPTGNRITYGVTIQADWNGFDLAAVFQGNGVVVRDFPELFDSPLIWGRNGLSMFMDRWHRADPFDPNCEEWIPGKYPSTFRDTQAWSSYTRASEFNRIDGTYLRLKSLEIGYSIPKELLSKIQIKGARIYLNGYNLLTFSDLNGITDPERPDNQDAGYTYPGTATYNIGVNLTF